MTSILGRSNDFISHEDGTVTTFFMVTPIFAENPDIIQARLIEKSYDELIIQAVAAEGLTEEDKKNVENTVISQMNDTLKRPMNMKFEWMDVIPPDENGKLRLIVNEMK